MLPILADLVETVAEVFIVLLAGALAATLTFAGLLFLFDLFIYWSVNGHL
jgi:hypothetical protein